MKRINQIGLIMYKEEAFKDVEKAIGELNRETQAYLKENGTFGKTGGIKAGWGLYQIFREAFNSYEAFDNYLILLAEKFAGNDEILMIGHNDTAGFMWVDYSSLETVKMAEQANK